VVLGNQGAAVNITCVALEEGGLLRPESEPSAVAEWRAGAGVVDEELAVLEVLRASNLETLPLSRLAETFQIAIEVTRATDHDIDRLDRRAGDLQRRYESALQERTSRRLGLLTVISAIFMPLTLIAGIYGMNFEVMPELHYRYGYPIALGAMALIAGGLAWYFRARWWGK